MATRNLARTVIEAGRTANSKYDRRQLRRHERRDGRAYCHAAVSAEDLDELTAAPSRRKTGYEFAQDDKLGPAKRWLASNVGRLWDDVYSELSSKFRNRGIALSHVVDTHMLGWVNYTGEERYWRFYDFVVDADGILQHNEARDPNRRRYSWSTVRADMKRAEAWVDGRKIIKHGSRVFWSSPDTVTFSDPWGRQTTHKVSHRQGQEFSAEDYAVFRSLHPSALKEILHPDSRS